MHTISTIGAALPNVDRTKVLTGDELVALYNRDNPNDVDVQQFAASCTTSGCCCGIEQFDQTTIHRFRNESYQT